MAYASLDHAAQNRVSADTDFVPSRAPSPFEERPEALDAPKTGTRIGATSAASSSTYARPGSRPQTPGKTKPPLKYNKRAIYILLIYVPVLILPWVLTAVLSYRPFTKPTWYYQHGYDTVGTVELNSVGRTLDAIKILNAIAGVITIPAISTLLAQAAVVYCERRSRTQSLSVSQVFALADRGWSSVSVLWQSLGLSADAPRGTSSRFLWLAALLLFISAVQVPVQSALVSFQKTTIMTCLDDPVYICKDGDHNAAHIPVVVAYDPEPGDMALLPQNMLVQTVASQLTNLNEHDVQPRMWADPSADDAFLSETEPAIRSSFFFNQIADLNSSSGAPFSKFFTTILNNGTTTGVLREHATRFNSSVQCSSIPQANFPSGCTGRRPFEAQYTKSGYLDIRVCVPGEYGVTPWTNIRDRQDIQEELYLDVTLQSNLETSVSFGQSNFTLHCTANTTRGYFEIGNYRNNYAYGPLIETWPTAAEMANDWNDHLGALGDFASPNRIGNSSIGADSAGDSLIDWGTQPADPYNTGGLLASGPLMTSAMAIFGNGSFFHTASNGTNSSEYSVLSALCQQNTIPFGQLDLLQFNAWQGSCSKFELMDAQTRPDEQDIPTLLWNWIGNFQQVGVAGEALLASMFFANQAMLTITSAATQTFGAREIYSAPGHDLTKPVVARGGIEVISILIALQLVGIVIIVWFIYRAPTWTYALDAMAVARIGRSLDHGDLPPIGPVSDADMRKLAQVDGLVGVQEHVFQDTAAPTSGRTPDIALALGARGLISRRLLQGEKGGSAALSKQEPDRIHTVA